MSELPRLCVCSVFWAGEGQVIGNPVRCSEIFLPHCVRAWLNRTPNSAKVKTLFIAHAASTLLVKQNKQLYLRASKNRTKRQNPRRHTSKEEPTLYFALLDRPLSKIHQSKYGGE